jgi:hypothetical protein
MVWSPSHDARLYLVLGVGLAGLLVLAFRFAGARNARSPALLALRALAVAVLFLILLNPTRVEHERHDGPRRPAVFLIDGSRSMSLESPMSRSEAARRLIDRAEGLLPSERRPEIRRFGFGRDLFAISESGGEEGKREGPGPEDDGTRLGRALEQLPARFAETLPFGVFVFSDGRSTEPEPLDSTARAYRELGVPVHVVPIGDERVSGDVAVQDIDAPREARPGMRVPVRVTLRSRGHAGERAEIRIRHGDGGKGDVLAVLPVTLAGGEQRHDLVIDTDRVRGPLAVEVPALPREAIAANNVVPFRIMVRPTKIRVIYMEGSGAPEYRFLHEALVDDPDITCVSMGVDNMYAVHPRLHRLSGGQGGYPTSREELFNYDVIICSDILRGAFTQEQLEWTAELVGQRGGGFAMIGGNASFGSGGWDETVWDGLIPLDMRGHGTGESEFSVNKFKVSIPAEALDHPIWRIVDDPVRNRAILARMPMFGGTNLVYRIKPAATVLGITDRPLEQADVTRARLARRPIPPTRPIPKRSGGRPAEADRPVIFACEPYGRGRTFAMATDTTWAWGTEFETSWGEGDNRYFRKFWRNVVYWLSENSTANRRLRVETDKVFYRAGEPIDVTARAHDEKLADTAAYRVVARLSRLSEDASRPFDENATDLVPEPGTPAYRGRITTPSPGEIGADPGSTVHQLRLDVAAIDGDRMAAGSSVLIQVIDDPVEFRDLRPDPSRLEGLAQATAGQVVRTPEDLATLLAGQHSETGGIDVVTRSPLWDRPALWVILMGLLTAEWMLRRVKGLA